jgi:hypothetical protein
MIRATNRVFVSCVTSEHAGIRQALRKYLARADCDVKVQEDFNVAADGTLDKLDRYIRHSTAVIQILGESDGSLVPEAEVHAYLAPMKEPFCAHLPKAPSAVSFDGLSYIQWEALIALHHRVPLFIYQRADAVRREETRPEAYAMCLRGASRHPQPFDSLADLLGMLIGDLRWVLTADPADVVVTCHGEAVQHQATYAARNGLEKAIHVHEMRFVLIPPATSHVGREQKRYPPIDRGGVPPFFYIQESVATEEQCVRLAGGGSLDSLRLREVGDRLLAAASRTSGAVRLPTVREWKHAARLDLIELAAATDELCAMDGDLWIVQHLRHGGTLKCTVIPVTNRNQRLPPNLRWRLVTVGNG